MRVVSQSSTGGVRERRFELEVAGERVPGVVWSPEGSSDARPLVLLGHGGSQHKLVEPLVARAHGYVTSFGFAVAAIDAPGHGERVTQAEAAVLADAIRARIAAGRRLGGEALADMKARANQAVPEWRAALTGLCGLDGVGEGPVGYWGVSMGTVIGLPLLAVEPRITAAVLGLAGLPPGDDMFAAAAARVSVPVEFVLQSDDELVSREAGIALFDALASREKTLHLNPGGHLAVPAFERASWERFFLRHLRPGTHC